MTETIEDDIKNLKQHAADLSQDITTLRQKIMVVLPVINALRGRIVAEMPEDADKAQRLLALDELTAAVLKINGQLQ